MSFSFIRLVKFAISFPSDNATEEKKNIHILNYANSHKISLEGKLLNKVVALISCYKLDCEKSKKYINLQSLTRVYIESIAWVRIYAHC